MVWGAQGNNQQTGSVLKFRPCIDIHEGRVKQIVGGSLDDRDSSSLITNFESGRKPEWYAGLYRRDGLYGGHVIMLGRGNEPAAKRALAAFPGGLHIGGGMTPETCKPYLDAGASHVIVTSFVFRDGRINFDNLGKMGATVGRERLVLDLSCRRAGGRYYVVTDRWQKFTDMTITAQSLESLSSYCAELLVHGVDVEGRQAGFDAELVELLSRNAVVPITYAGGVRSLEDLDRIENLGRGRIDVTIGSSLDLFGGPTSYTDVVAWHRARNPA